MSRVPFNASAPFAPPTSINATLTHSQSYRLKQNAISTRILDALLIAIALCIAVSFFLMDTQITLPKNPASIAAGASLLAGDPDMLKPESLPGDAQRYGDEELEEKGVWEGCVFRLGWWGEDDGGKGGRGRFGVDMERVEE